MKELLKTSSNGLGLPSFDLQKELPDLKNAVAINADLGSEYWTPQSSGESKRVFFQKIEMSNYTDEKTGETIELPCVVMLSQDAKLNIVTIRNGSKRLVAAVEESFNKGVISEGTPLEITYIGKEKNKSNSYMSDRWSIKPLIL